MALFALGLFAIAGALVRPTVWAAPPAVGGHHHPAFATSVRSLPAGPKTLNRTDTRPITFPRWCKLPSQRPDEGGWIWLKNRRTRANDNC